LRDGANGQTNFGLDVIERREIELCRFCEWKNQLKILRGMVGKRRAFRFLPGGQTIA